MGLSPEFLCHFCTCPMRSMSPEPVSGTPSSGQPVYWNCFTGNEEASWMGRGRNEKIREHVVYKKGLLKMCARPYLFIHQLHLSQCIVRILIHCVQDHLKLAVHTGSIIRRPVFMAFDPSPFSLLGEHDNAGTFGLPHHPPEVVSGIWQGPLGCNEGLALVVALNK